MVADNMNMQRVKTRSSGLGEPESSGPPIWLVSFTDVIALMLTFFVLLYSMSDADPEKFEYKIGVTQNAAADYSGPRQNAGSDEGLNFNRMDFVLAEDLQYLEALFSQIKADNQWAQDHLAIEGRGDLLTLYIREGIQTNDRDFLIFLNNLEPILESLDNRIELASGTDSVEMFDKLQVLGRILKQYGYDNTISISVRPFLNPPLSSQMAIAIRSNDGRRIAR